MMFYRNVVWFVKGLCEYMKNGYIVVEKLFDLKVLDVDVLLWMFMIIGVNSGIGKDIVVFLVKKGVIVYMVCCSEIRGEEVWKEISELLGNDKVILYIFDMFKFRMVWEFVDKFLFVNEVFYVFINNVGCMVNIREVDEDGLEKNFVINSLGMYILIFGFMFLFFKNEVLRVIIVLLGWLEFM